MLSSDLSCPSPLTPAPNKIPLCTEYHSAWFYCKCYNFLFRMDKSKPNFFLKKRELYCVVQKKKEMSPITKELRNIEYTEFQRKHI